jgi:HlyD family secretion protein
MPVAEYVRLRENEKTVTARSLNRHALTALALIVVLAGGSGVWAATTEISGAMIAGGSVVVEGGSKLVQHQEGGIVAQIDAQNEDVVEAGDLLVRLDGTTVSAGREVVLAQLREAFARYARLTAESIGAAELALPVLAEGWPADPELDRLLAAQQRLLDIRKGSIDAQISRLEEQITQLDQQIEGLTAQQAGVDGELAILADELVNIEQLFAQQLVDARRVNDLKREHARLQGEHGRLISQIAATRANIAERRVAAGQVTQDFRSEVMAELQTAGQQIAELMQQRIAADDRLKRLEIRAPIGGVIHQSRVETVGGVVGAGEVLMVVVPQESQLAVDARFSPLDIDRLRIGQPVILKLVSLDVRTTPDLNGTVRTISPDLTTDPATGHQYYTVRVDVADAELAKLPEDLKLVPGMPAEVFAQTGNRTVWAYLIHPIAQEMSRAWRED